MKKSPAMSDIEEMRARGYDASVIAEQRELANRGQILEALVAATAKAFAGVTLGSGVGLLEANGRDDYADEESLAAFREQDEKLDWSVIPLDQLNRYSSSLSFFDAEGMRFHLPAFLMADMQGNYAFDILYSLTQSTLVENQCALLTDAQRNVIRQYLLFAAEEEYLSWDRGHIQKALVSYWAN